MNKKKIGRMLSILLCITVLMTQAIPISFAYAEEQRYGETASDLSGDDEIAGNPDGDAEDPSEDGAAVIKNADETLGDGVTDEDGNGDEEENGSDSLGDDSGWDSGEEPKDRNGKGETSDDELGISLLSEEASSADISWYSKDSETKNVTLTTAAQLRGLAALVNGTAADSTGTSIAATSFSGWTITLGADIDLGGTDSDGSNSSSTGTDGESTAAEWTPIGDSSSHAFKGVFDGAGHEISGMSITESAQYMGFFGYLNGADISNLKLSGKIATAPVSTAKPYIGGAAGYAASSHFSDVGVDIQLICTETAAASTSAVYVGGMAGYGSELVAEDCSAEGKLTISEETASRVFYAGGMFGYLSGTSQAVSCSSDVQLDIKTKGSSYVGGIVGYLKGSGELISIDSCVNSGSVTVSTSSSFYAGGIAGSISKTKTIGISGSVNKGKVTVSSSTASTAYAGGISGYLQSIIVNSANCGAIEAQMTGSSNSLNAGGISGLVYNSNGMKNCVNFSDDMVISAGGIVGTIAGYVNSSLILDSCYALSGSSYPLYNGSPSTLTGNSVGTFDEKGIVTAAEGFELTYADSAELIRLLNGWVCANALQDSAYRLWTGTSFDSMSPNGTEIFGAAAPAIEISASAPSAKTGAEVTLKAKISAEANSTGSENRLSWQWYMSDYSSKSNPVALTGENASGSADGLTAEAVYTLSEDSFSDKYYYVVVTNEVIWKDGDTVLGSSSGSADSDAASVVFAEDIDGYLGETAEAFAGGEGTAESPYLIATPAQLKLMSERISDGTGNAAHYRLTADIDFNHMRWTSAGETKSTTVKTFSGTFDGDGHVIKNLNIVSDKTYAGMFCKVTGTVKNVEVNGSLKANGSTYAGGIAGDFRGFLCNVVSDIDISVTDCQYIGGLAGISYTEAVIQNCVYAGNIDYQITEGFSVKSYLGGLVGYIGSKSTFNNSCSSAVFSGDLPESRTGLLVGYGTTNLSLEYCYAFSEEEAHLPLFNGTAASNYFGTYDASGKVTAADGYTLAYEDAADLRGQLNRWVVENADADGSYKLWKSSGSEKKGLLYTPSGSSLNIEAPEISLTAAADPEDEAKILLTASVNVKENQNGTTSLSYQWYRALYQSGNNAEALTERIEMTDADLSQPIELKYTATGADSSYYYYIVVTSAVTYFDEENKEEVIGSTSASQQSETINITFDSSGNADQEEIVESFAKGSGTESDPYIITTAAELRLMEKQINGGDADNYYELGNDIDFSSRVWNPAGQSAAFTGSFDGKGHTIKNIRIVTDETYAGFFGQAAKAVIQNVTLEGALSCYGSKYAGGVIGYAEGLFMENVTNRMTINATDCTYVGGVAGELADTSSSASALSVIDCRNEGTVKIRFQASYVAPSVSEQLRYVGGFTGYVNYGTLKNCINTGDVDYDSKIVDTQSYYLYIGGFAGYGASANLLNLSNTGSVTAAAESEKESLYVYSFGNVTLQYAAEMKNCLTSASVAITQGNGTTYSGFCTSIPNNYDGTMADCYAPEGSTSQISSGNKGKAYGIGTFDAEGKLTALKGYELSYERSDSLRARMDSSYSDLFCALNIRAADNGYRSWEGEGNDLLPVGSVKTNPLSSVELAVTVDDLPFGENFAADAELPNMEAEVTTAGENTVYYQWYKASENDFGSAEAMTGADALTKVCAPERICGPTYYFMTASAVSGCFFKTAVSDVLTVRIDSADGIWVGLEAEESELKGHGTESDPYLISSGNLLALVSRLVNENVSAPAADEDGTAYAAYNEAVYRITDDIPMDGVHSFTPIGCGLNSGTSYYFKGTVYGQKEDGSIPTISNLVLAAGKMGSGLFGSAQGATLKDLNISNAVNYNSNASYPSVILIAVGTDVTISGVTVSGKVDSSNSACGVAGNLSSGSNVIENCVNYADITAGSYAGGICYTFGSATEIRNCRNEGTVIGASEAGGIAGYNVIGKIVDCQNNGTVKNAKSSSGNNQMPGVQSSATFAGGIAGSIAMAGTYSTDAGQIISCVNTGEVSGIGFAGGIAGSSKGTISDCRNEGSVISNGTAAVGNRANASMNYLDISGGSAAGGIVGVTQHTGPNLIIENCYNIGKVSSDADAEGFTPVLGGVVGYVCYDLKADNNYFLSDESVTEAVASAYDGVVITGTSSEKTADEMKTAAFALDLGDAYLIAPDQSVSGTAGYPLLSWEADEVYTVSIQNDHSGESGTSAGENPSALMKIGGHEVESVAAAAGAVFSVEAVSVSEGYRVKALSQRAGEEAEAAALTPNSDGTYTLTVTDNLVLTAELAKSIYTVELRDSTQSEGKATVYQPGDEISVDVIVRATEEGQTVSLGAVQGDVTYDSELLTYIGSTADETDHTAVSETETGNLLFSVFGRNGTIDNTGVNVVTLKFRANNYVNAENMTAKLDVSAAADEPGSEPDMNDRSQMAVPAGTEVTLAATNVVFITDYAAAPAGCKLAAYRTKLALDEGTAVFYDGDAMIHASAFDTLVLEPAATDSFEDSSASENDADNSVSDGNVIVSKTETSDETIYTYIYFVADATTQKEAASSLTLGEGSNETVDYADYDITENNVVNIFDAQRVWDLFSFENFLNAVDFVMNPSMYQRLHADLNQDGSVDVMDALKIQRYLHYGEETLEGGDSEETDPAA